jgi:hypothetical protein
MNDDTEVQMPSEVDPVPLTKVSICLRVVAALALAFVTYAAWMANERPSCTLCGHSVEAHRFRMGESVNDFSKLADDQILAAIPRGETELRRLPERVRSHLMFLSFREKDLDLWDHPYLLRAEQRATGLWLGLYSKGEDGKSATHGNDADDFNTWGRLPADPCPARRAHQDAIELAKGTALFWAIYLPMCLLGFRSRSRRMKRRTR